MNVAWERFASNVAFMLLLSLGAAWLLGVIGLDRPYFERVGVSFLSLFLTVYAVSEGAEIGFARCLTCEHEHETAELPEAEQAINE